jgi:cytochrome P450
MDDHFKRYGDIYKAVIYGTPVYVVRRLDYAQHVLRKNYQNYTKGQAIKRIGFLLGNGLMVSEGQLWKSQRQMIQPAFHGNVVGALTNVITTANISLRKKWEHAAQEEKSVNITHDISKMVLEVVLISIFGSDYEQVRTQFDIVSDESARNLQFAQMFRSLGELVVRVTAQRRKARTTSTDILGILMAARDRVSGKAMPDGQLVKEILTLVVAGHETTASSLNWTWYLLSQHPEVEEKLWGELDSVYTSEYPAFADLPRFTFTRQVLDEAMRLYPPGWLMTRRALRDDQLGDYFVPAGTEIYIPPYFIQRHPDLWEAPDRFNPDRLGPDHSQERRLLGLLPFSLGPRNCVGELLARVEMQIHLITIAKQLQLRYDEKKPPELEAGVNLRSKHDFIMTPVIRTSANSRPGPKSADLPAVGD